MDSLKNARDQYIAGILDVIRNELLLSNHVFKLTALSLVKPHISKMWIFWQPGNVNLAEPQSHVSLFCSLVQMDMMTWPR